MDKYIIQMYVYVKQLFLMHSILFYFTIFKFIKKKMYFHKKLPLINKTTVCSIYDLKKVDVRGTHRYCMLPWSWKHIGSSWKKILSIFHSNIRSLRKKLCDIKYSDSQCCWKKYSDCGGKKNKLIQYFCHIT
jgi:hypothetical protein